MSADIDAIKERIDRAEYAAIHVANNYRVWMHFYDDGIENSRLINDFKQLVRENEQLRHKLSEATYKLEAAGVRNDD